MPSLQAYKEFTRELKVTLSNDEILTIHYKPSAYSGDFQKRISEGETTKSDDAFLMQVLASWDFLDEHKKPVKITADVLSKEIAMGDRKAIVETIFADIFPNDTTATPNSSPTP